MINPERDPAQFGQIDEFFSRVGAEEIGSFSLVMSLQERLGLQMILDSHHQRNSAFVDGFILRHNSINGYREGFDKLSYVFGVMAFSVFYEDSLADRDAPWVNTYDSQLCIDLATILKYNKLLPSDTIASRLSEANPAFIDEFVRIADASSRGLYHRIVDEDALRGVYDYLSVARASRKQIAFEEVPELPSLPGSDSLQTD